MRSDSTERRQSILSTSAEHLLQAGGGSEQSHRPTHGPDLLLSQADLVPSFPTSPNASTQQNLQFATLVVRICRI